MKDRIPLYPGRVTLVPVAGQTNTYDMVRADQPIEAGTPISKATLLTDATAAKLGGNSNMLPSEAFDAIAGRLDPAWTLLWYRETAGSGTWTAPDINGGQPYEIGVMIISGGGGGPVQNYSPGGFSGRTAAKMLTVSPGQNYSWVCGAGGLGGVIPSSGGRDANGGNGGSSSFAGLTAVGGLGGRAGGNYPETTMYEGAQLPCFSALTSFSSVNMFGGKIQHTNKNNVFSVPSECYNPFTQEHILGAGGFAMDSATGIGGKNSAGIGGGDGKRGGTTGNNATGNGCGGGALFLYTGENIGTGGNGGAGAIYLYVRGLSV